jgi:hypothetical protein
LYQPVFNKIEIRHTCIIIHNYDPGDDERLEHLFSIYNKAYHRYEPKGAFYDAENRDYYLPAGIDMFHIVNSFGEDTFHKMSPDPYDRVELIKLKCLPRDEVQEKAINFCLGREGFENNLRCPQLFVNLNTGKGKTYVAITVAAYYCLRTMMITCSLDWIKQWREKILEYTDTTEDQIYIISGSSSIAKLLNGMKSINDIKFFLCSHDTLKAYAAKYGWDKVHQLFMKLKIGVKIYDESHLYFDNICMIDYFSDTWKTYYLTATPARSDGNENRIYQISYKNIPKINLFNKEEDPHTAYISILFNSHPKAIDLNRSQNAYGFNQIWYANYLVGTKTYYKLLWIIMELVLNTTSGKILMYIGTNYAILRTYDWLKFHYPNLGVGLFTSLVPKEQKRLQLNNKVILTTTKSAGAAVDIDGLEVTVVLDEPFKSPVLARQTLGRTRADNTKYIDIVDVGFDSLRYYYKAKSKIFKKYAATCSEIRLSDHEISQRIIQIIDNEQKMIDAVQQRSNLKQVVEIVKK